MFLSKEILICAVHWFIGVTEGDQKGLSALQFLLILPRISTFRKKKKNISHSIIINFS